LDTQALQLHDKVQKLIEQYTKDKKRLAELEAELASKGKDSEGFSAQINQLKSEVQSLLEKNRQLEVKNTELTSRVQDMESMLSTFEGFAADINTRIDDLIPQIEQL
jgi:chromosome segregation ATPase